MGERLRPQPRPYVLGQTEIIKGRKTSFKLLLADSTNKTLQKGDYRLQGLEGFKVCGRDKDKIFFYSPSQAGVIVCDVKKRNNLSIKVHDESQEFTAYTVGSHADSWFNEILKTPDLKVVARPIPNPQ